MQLRRFPGLYAIGEAIDVNGITGGYNLQMCWSTASAAAESLHN
jgi:predicted flavoprotein YhiN